MNSSMLRGIWGTYRSVGKYEDFWGVMSYPQDSEGRNSSSFRIRHLKNTPTGNAILILSYLFIFVSAHFSNEQQCLWLIHRTERKGPFFSLEKWVAGE